MKKDAPDISVPHSDEKPPESTNNNDIEASEAVKEFHDPLLACLLLITKLENTPCSETSLIAGLPLVDEKLTPELFVRAAERAGLNAKVKQKAIIDIPEIVLPATLL